MDTTLKAENYLKALYSLADDDGEVGVKKLSDTLGVKMSTINAMIKRLNSNGYVDYELYKPLKLTPQGIIKAKSIIRKHRLTEMFLVNVMGLGWEQVHDIAEQVEHINSELFFDKMDELLGFPNIDPHGSPIPDKDGNITIINGKQLSKYVIGDNVTFIAVLSSSNNLLSYLNTKNISLNTEFKIIDIEPYDGTISIILNDQVIHLSKKATEHMLCKIK